jgi:hypothetical protein
MTPGPQLQPIFPPPASAVSLVPGTVMHARMKPKPHRFSYKVFNLLIDLDRLTEAGRASRLFSIGRRFNLAGFRESDHGDGKTPLRSHVERLLRPAGVDISGGRVLLLCYPRILGFVFNPISVYFCYDADDALAAVIYEVRNTFGEMHTYVAPVAAGELSEAGLRQSRAKLFYVSPFLDMALRYHFRLLPPGDAVRVRILETDAEGPILAASFAGTREDLTTSGLLAQCLAIPFMTLKVVAGIHWEALKLWLKGVGLRARPAPPGATSYADRPEPPAAWTQHRPLPACDQPIGTHR